MSTLSILLSATLFLGCCAPDLVDPARDLAASSPASGEAADQAQGDAAPAPIAVDTAAPHADDAPMIPADPSASPSYLVAWTDAGELAIVGVASGEVVATSPALAMGGLCDAAVDADAGRVLAFESDEEFTWGEVSAYALDLSVTPPSFGDRVALRTVDGDARVAAAPGAALVFSYGPTTEWSLVRDDGAYTPGSLAGRPQSLLFGRDGEAMSVTAITADDADGTLKLTRASVSGGALSLLDAAPTSLSPEATPHLVRVGAEEWLARVDGGELTLGEIGAKPRALGVHAKRVEAAVALGDGAVAILTTGPSKLVVARAASSEVDALDLPALGGETGFFSRSLLEVTAERVLVATEVGVLAVVRASSGALSLDPTFDGASLRGPLAGLLP